jgi:uncharacterized protein
MSEVAFYPGRAPIDAYGGGGFRFAAMSHRGSIICTPSGIAAWAPARPEDLTLQAFARVLTERSEIGLLLLGTGREATHPSVEVRSALADAGISLEIMDTGAACRTYNVLLAEGRPVAAALIAVA